LMVADSGEVFAAWHGGERDSGRFTGWHSAWKEESARTGKERRGNPKRSCAKQ